MKFKSIGSRVFVSVIPAIIVTTILFVLMSYYTSERKTNELLNEKMLQNLQSANLEIKMELQRNSAIAESIAVYAGIITENYSGNQTHDNDNINDYLCKLLTQNPNTINIGIYFATDRHDNDLLNDSYFAYIDDSDEIACITNYSDYVDYLNEDWYVDAMNANGETAWSLIYLDPIVKTNVITASKAFYDSNGEFCGVVMADMALDNVQRIVNEISIDESGKAFIISKLGKYITFYDDSRNFNDTITQEEDPEWAALGELLITPTSGSTSIIDNGVKKFVHYMTMEDVTWTLAIIYSAQEFNLYKINDFLSTTIIPVIGLIAVAIGVFMVIRYLHKIINKVNDFSKLAATGKLTEHIEIMETDEFGIMEQYLNKMISNMNDMNNHSIQLLEQAKAANVAKSDFLSKMSHEIRTPMTAIIGMTQIARSTDDYGKIQNCLGKIDNASKHLLNLINDILDMSKIEANKLELYYENFDFMNCMNKIYNVVNVKAEEKHHQLSINIDESVPTHIIGDELRITQIFTNLIGNSIKFTPEQGTITVDIKETERDWKYSVIEVNITDNGIGISDEQQSKLFKSFEQADGSVSRKFGGTGLGLTICKRMVEMMGGTIRVKSELNKGSTFAFQIKVERGSDIVKEEMPQIDDVHIRNCRILAVDDSEESIDYLQHILNNFSLNCDTAKNGLEAIGAVKKSIKENKPYHIIFMDYYMAGLNGIEATKKIMEISNESISIIMVSISDWKDIEYEAKNAGITKHITKPVTPSSVLDKIYNAINNTAQLTVHKMDLSNRDFSKNHILIVEDNEINVEIVLALLEDTKINIDVAENGMIACQKFESNPEIYDLILMDIQMPEMDGYEATRKIRGMEIPKAKIIPIIAMTANAFKEDFDKCMEAGMVDHISKPIDPEVFMIKLNDYLFMKDYLGRDIF